MRINPARQKGGAPLLGASQPGEPGPFGISDIPGDDLEAAVTARVQARIAAARARRDRRQAQRQALQAARQHGVAARHRAKLARNPNDQPPPDAA